jgi:group I intron endonuclease
MYLYQATNTITGNKYYGITNNFKRRLSAHRTMVLRGKKTKFYDAVRGYGWDAFVWEVLEEGTDDAIAQKEVELIKADSTCYNLHPGGKLGLNVMSLGTEASTKWRHKLSLARKGRQPALGMSHTDETKKLCGEYGKLRWDIYGRYPAEVLDYGFADSNKKFGISRTHYYRLRKQRQQSNDLL